MTHAAVDEYGLPEGALTERERALLFEAVVAHHAMIRALRAMRENTGLCVVQRALSAEHLLHMLQAQQGTLGMALKIAQSAERLNRTIAGNMTTLSDAGVHYRGLTDEGGALVAVRR